jgi:hypothetical protein
LDDPFSGFGDGMGYEVRFLNVRGPDIPRVIRRITGPDQDGMCTRALTKLHVDPFITDHVRPRYVDIEIFRSLIDHAGAGLSASALPHVLSVPCRGVVRAIIYGIDAGTVLLKHSGQTIVRFMHKGLREITARHAGLVRYEHDQKTGLVHAPDRGTRARDQPEVGKIAQIAHFFIDRSVAIQKNRSIHIFILAGSAT